MPNAKSVINIVFRHCLGFPQIICMLWPEKVQRKVNKMCRQKTGEKDKRLRETTTTTTTKTHSSHRLSRTYLKWIMKRTSACTILCEDEHFVLTSLAILNTSLRRKRYVVKRTESVKQTRDVKNEPFLFHSSALFAMEWRGWEKMSSWIVLRKSGTARWFVNPFVGAW